VILLTGATGTVGRHLVLELKTRRAHFRVLTRDPQKAAAILGSAEFAVGDLSRPETVTKALVGVKAAFLLSAVDPALAAWEASFARSAKKAGVERIVKLSAQGADPRSACELLRWHAEAEAEVTRAGVPAVHARPASFYQNFFNMADGIRRGSIHAPLADAGFPMVDARDVAAVAAVALTSPGFIGATVNVTGPAALSYADCAAALSAELKRPVAYVPAAAEDARRGMLAAGMPAWRVDALSQLFTELREGRGGVVTETVFRMTGQPAKAFADFVRDHREAFA
jgi:uncharacterized protein YbjT (DUF2867 family)